MKPAFNATAIARLTGFAAAAVLFGGGYLINRHYEPAIGDALENAAAYAAKTASNRRVSEELPALRRAERTALASLNGIAGAGTASQDVAALIEALDRASRTRHVSIAAIQPGAAAQQPGSLPGTSVTIRVRGRFRELLGFLADIAHTSVVLGVQQTQFALSGRAQNGRDPILDATIGATLYRVTVPPAKRSGDVAAGR